MRRVPHVLALVLTLCALTPPATAEEVRHLPVVSAGAGGDVAPAIPTTPEGVVAVIGTGSSTIDRGRVSLYWGPLTGANLFSIAKGSNGRPIIAGPTTGGAGAQLALGFWPASDGHDRLHIALAGLIGGGAQSGAAFGSVTLGILPSFGGFEHIPLIGIGPAVMLPIASSAPPAFQILATVGACDLITKLTGSPG